jgi:Fe-S-cluster containining protein
MDDEEHGRYGRSQKVLCPLLDAASGLCQIHNYRNAVCSTYFCYNDQEEAGQVFWAQLQTLGSQLELSLAQWALRRVGFDLDGYFKVLNQQAQQLSDLSAAQGWCEEVLQKLWGDWYGREKQLFQLCAAQIAEHRNQLWAIAMQAPIREADAFERAMDALLPLEEGDEEEISDSVQPFDPRISWQACLEAYAVLKQISNDLD